MYPPAGNEASNGAATQAQQGGQAAPPTQGNAPPPQPAPGATQPAPGVGAGAAGPGAGGSSGVASLPQGAAQPQTQQTQQQAQSVRDVLRTMYGLDLGQNVTDDHQALAYLAQQARLAQSQHQMVQYGQQYVQHAGEFNAWRQQQAQAQAAQQAQQNTWWKAPEYDPSWTQKIVRDQNGALQVIPGADPSILPKYMGWVEHQRNFMDKMAQDPIGAIKPGLEQLIDQRAQQLIEQRFGGYEQQTQAKQFVEQNSGWLHAKDASGQKLIDPRTNMPALTPAGQRFLSYVQEGEQMGLPIQAQQRYAMANLKNDVMTAQFQAWQQQQAAQQTQQPQVNPADAPKQAFLLQAQQGQNRPAVPPGNVNGSPPPVVGGSRTLQDMLMLDMVAGGFQPGQTVIG